MGLNYSGKLPNWSIAWEAGRRSTSSSPRKARPVAKALMRLCAIESIERRGANSSRRVGEKPSNHDGGLLRDSTSSVVLLSGATRCRGGGFKASAGSRYARRASARRRGLILPTRTAFCRRTNEATMSWTDERIEQLKHHWMEGKSASQIASLLGNGVSRNAVIGKVHRLGLAGRAKSPGLVSSRPRPFSIVAGRASRRCAAHGDGCAPDHAGSDGARDRPAGADGGRTGGVRERRRADVAQGDDHRTERSDVPLAAGRPGQLRIPLLRIARRLRSVLHLSQLPRVPAGSRSAAGSRPPAPDSPALKLRITTSSSAPAALRRQKKNPGSRGW